MTNPKRCDWCKQRINDKKEEKNIWFNADPMRNFGWADMIWQSRSVVHEQCEPAAKKWLEENHYPLVGLLS